MYNGIRHQASGIRHQASGRNLTFSKLVPFSALFLAAFLLAALASCAAAGTWEKTQAGLGLGANEIASPNPPDDDGWHGSKVYYGTYKDGDAEGQPVLYRVLSKDETAFTDADHPTLFLDCDTVLTMKAFGTGNTWDGSAVQAWLQGDFYDGSFTAQEQAAIAESSRTPPGEKTLYGTQGAGPKAIDLYLYHTSLNSEKVFLLDVTEATSPAYGYPSDTAVSKAREKSLNNTSYPWWLRSPSSNTQYNAIRAGVVSMGGGSGIVGGGASVTSLQGVSPALNVRRSSVVFSSLINEAKKTYKLTLRDSGMAVTGTASWGDEVVTVSYAVTKGSPARLSLLMTNGAWNDGGGWSRDAKVKYYQSAPLNGAASGKLIFDLPGGDLSGLNAYILAETVNGETETDYASAPVLAGGSGQSSGGDEEDEISDRSGSLSLGTNKIANPDGTNGGGWSYVYYGRFQGNPVKYRVLDRRTSNFGGTALLLDCDTILLPMAFKSDNSSNAWAGSDVKTWLNGDGFLNNDGVFTAQEKAAIAESNKAGKAAGEEEVTLPGTTYTFGYAPLNSEKVFLLDAAEAARPSYGYPRNGDAARVKAGYTDDCYSWWLRSPIEFNDASQAGCVNSNGEVTYANMNLTTIAGVSPAFNVALPSILFASVIEGKAGQPGAEYKLTLLDTGSQGHEKLTVTNPQAALSGTKVTATYTVNGTDADKAQASVLMTDGEWENNSGWGENAEAKYYAPLAGTDGAGGTFTLPEKYDPTKWKTYLVAEKVNSTYRSNYASAPVSVNVPYVAVTGVRLNRTSAAIETGRTVTLSADVLPENATIRTVTWKSNNTAVATVDANGNVKGISAGTATITATSRAYNAQSADCTVTVRGESVSPTPKNDDGGGTGGNPGGEDTRPEPRPDEITLSDGTTIPYAGVETPDPAVAQAVEQNLAALLPGLPSGVPFFSGAGNMTFPDVNGLLSFIGEIYERVTGQHVEFKVVLWPVKVSVPGVYLVKIALTEEQRRELKGSRSLAYHVAPCETAGVQIAEEDAESSDGSYGVLLDANGGKLTGEQERPQGGYDGAGELYALACLAQADVTYVQYLTAEADEEQESPASDKGSGGCDALRGTVAGLGSVTLLAMLALAGKRR